MSILDQFLTNCSTLRDWLRRFFYLVSLRLSDQPLFRFPSVLFLSVLIASQTQFAPIVTGAFSLPLPPFFSLLSLLTLLKHRSCSFGVWLVRSGFLVSRWNFPCRVELGDSLRPAITSRLESFIGECFPINYAPRRIDNRCCSVGYKFPWKLRVHFSVQFIVSLLRSSTIKFIYVCPNCTTSAILGLIVYVLYTT